MTSLAGRLAVVTGASSGIGRAIAVTLGGAGAALLVAGRDAGRLSEAAQAARAEGAMEVTEFAADLTAEGAAGELASCAARLGGAGVLVHSAGVYARGEVAKAPLADLDSQYAANLRAPWELTRLLLPQLARAKGDAVFVNSTQGLSASPGVGQFAATQHALRALADALRGEVNAEGIRVLTVHVGRTATPRQERIFAMEGRSYTPERLMQPSDVAAVILAAVTLPRTAEVTAITLRPMIKT